MRFHHPEGDSALFSPGPRSQGYIRSGEKKGKRREGREKRGKRKKGRE